MIGLLIVIVWSIACYITAWVIVYITEFLTKKICVKLKATNEKQ